jgi:AcrR family transcriptional regulator
LLAAAAQAFAQAGYHETKVSSIVAHAGLTQAAFYLYFPSKEAIFAELLAELRARLTDLVHVVRLRPGLTAQDLPTRIQASLALGFRFMQENADLTRIGLFLAPEAPQIQADIVTLVAANLRSEQADGYVRAAISVEFAAECLVAMMLRLAQQDLFTGKHSPDALADQLADLLLHGVIQLAVNAGQSRQDTSTERPSMSRGE